MRHWNETVAGQRLAKLVRGGSPVRHLGSAVRNGDCDCANAQGRHSCAVREGPCGTCPSQISTDCLEYRHGGGFLDTRCDAVARDWSLGHQTVKMPFVLTVLALLLGLLAYRVLSRRL